MLWLGVLLSLLSAVLLSFGAQLQHSGVQRGQVEDEAFGLKHFLALFRSPRWLAGLSILGVASVLHLAGLSLAPVIVVQPVGIIGLVITTLMYARLSHTRLTRGLVQALVLCVVGVTGFVGVAAVVAREPQITDHRLIIVLGVLAFLFVLALIVLWRTRHDVGSAFIIVVAGGSLHGFDAILLKAILSRWQHDALFTWLTLACLVGLGLAFSLGTYFVQQAYAVSAPDAVLSGLTVVDPLVAVLVGAIVLREAAGAPWWTLFVFVAAGVLAVVGVVRITRARRALSGVAGAGS